MNNKKKFVSLFELKCWYLVDTLHLAMFESAMFGKHIEPNPTLTGWIEYWRKYSKDSHHIIIYPERKKESHEIPF